VREGESKTNRFQPQLLIEPSMGRRFQGLFWCGVAATGIRPNAGPGLFAPGALLEERLPALVEQEN